MARKRIIKTNSSSTIEEAFPRFVTSQAAKGISESTIKTYNGHFHCIGKHLDLTTPFSQLTKEDLDNMVVSMRQW